MGFNSKYTGTEIEELLDTINDSNSVILESVSQEEFNDVFINN